MCIAVSDICAVKHLLQQSVFMFSNMSCFSRGYVTVDERALHVDTTL